MVCVCARVWCGGFSLEQLLVLKNKIQTMHPSARHNSRPSSTLRLRPVPHSNILGSCIGGAPRARHSSLVLLFFLVRTPA